MPSLECQKRASRNYYAKNTVQHNLECNKYYLKNCEEIKRKRRERYALTKLQVPISV